MSFHRTLNATTWSVEREAWSEGHATLYTLHFTLHASRSPDRLRFLELNLNRHIRLVFLDELAQEGI